MKVAVISFPASNCDRDALVAVKKFTNKVLFYELDVNKHEELMSNNLFITDTIPNFKLYIYGEKKLDLMGIDAIQKIEETLLELNI